MIKSLNAYLWGKKVGTLMAYTEHHVEKACFYFDREFARGHLDIAPLHASIKSTAAQNGMPIYAESDKAYGGLPSFIADSLPDHWGNRVFERWAQANHLRMRHITSLDRLTYIGSRGMGALEFVPSAAKEMESPLKVQIAELHNLAQYAATEAQTLHIKIGNDLMIQSLFKVGTSAGGRRPKAIININLHSMECYSGQVAAPEPGYTPMIIKFDERNDIPTTRIEYSYYLMAREAGLNMQPSRLLQDGPSTHFLTERFDRHGDEKLHVQTLAAIDPHATSYEELFDAARRLKVSTADMQQLFLQMVLNVLCGNVDDHNKNFSFIMDKDGEWHSAPAYDFTFAIDTSAPWYVNGHCLTINDRNHGITRHDLLSIADAYGIKSPNGIIDRAIDAASHFSHHAAEAELPSAWTGKINDFIKSQALEFFS
jgi:serine/threonine-protein kinase HipA